MLESPKVLVSRSLGSHCPTNIYSLWGVGPYKLEELTMLLAKNILLKADKEQSYKHTQYIRFLHFKIGDKILSSIEFNGKYVCYICRKCRKYSRKGM